MRLSRRQLLAAAAAAALPRLARAAQPRQAGESFTLDVPVEHGRPDLGRLALACEWGAPYRHGLPVVIAVADGQQFYVRPGGAARLHRDLFGDALNVLAIVGRSRAAEIERRVMAAGEIDWAAAYRLLDWRQWAGDVDAVIRHLALPGGELGLYGRSGGAHLIHQLLALRPDLEARAYVQAAVNHELDVRWGLGADRFWEEFSASSPKAAAALAEWLAQRPAERRELVLVLQRQHFFEGVDGLPGARLAAVRAFLDGDRGAVAGMRARYQLDAIEGLRGSAEGVGSVVRLYEFAAPHDDPRGLGPPLRPDVEALFHHAFPLAEPAFRPRVPATDWGRLRDQRTEVLQVAGRHDHTCDYRTQVGLHGLTRGSELLLLDDDHVFRRWSEAGTQPRLLQAFFLHGLRSSAFREAMAAVEPLRWREGRTP